MRRLGEWILKHPVAPYIRECDYAARTPWIVHGRRLLDYLLIYVQEGRCRFTVDGEPYEFGRGEFCLIQPGSLNVLEGLTDTVTPFAHFDLFYHPDREQSFPTRPGQVDLTAYSHLLQPRLDELLGFRIPVRLKPGNPGRMRDTFLRVMADWREPDPIRQMKAQHGLSEIMLQLLEELAPVPTAKGAPPSLNWISSYMSIRLSEPISILDMAKRANLSASRFSTLFKSLYGKPPHQYLMDMRINHALELLQTTDLPQEQIAAYCGFSDIHHFSKAFRGKTGHPPGNVRKNLIFGKGNEESG